MIFDFFRKKPPQPSVHVDKYLIHIKDIKKSTITVNTRDNKDIEKFLHEHSQVLGDIKTLLEAQRDQPAADHLFQQIGQHVKYQLNAGGDIHYHEASKPVEETYLPHPPVNTAAQHLFIGRDRALEQLEAGINAEKAVLNTAVEGMAGVGKSYLVDHFALKMGYEDRYTVLALNPQQLDSVEDLLTRLAKRLQVEPQLVASTLKSQNWLVHIENVDSDPAAEIAGKLLGQLTGCRLVLTGRLSGLGQLPQCQTIELTPFSIEEGVQQLQEELASLNAEPLTTEEAQQLVTALGGLPLAIHLAAGYLVREGVDAFLQQFRDTAFNLPPKNSLEQGRDAERLIVKKTFELSLNLLTPEQRQAVAVMGYAPPEGIGLNLVAALMDKEEKAAQQLLHQVAHLSLVIDLRQQRNDPPRWKMHPLLAELMRVDHEVESIQARLHDWFMARLPEPEGEDYSAWHSVQAEEVALNQYLATIPLEQGIELEQAGSFYADLNGSWWHWLQFCQHLLTQTVTDEQRSNILWTCCRCAQRLGKLDIAEQAAQTKSQLDQQLENEYEYALARAQIADILYARGELEEALRIHTEEELPVYERLGDVREKAVTQGKIADILYARGELEEALRIRTEEVLPTFERLGDVREKAVTQGKIADILYARGELEEALRIRTEEELPVYERLGNVRSKAVTQGQIADILYARGELEEALRIRTEEVLPTFERLGDVRELLVGRVNTAILLMSCDTPNKEEAQDLLCLALTAARRLKIPEAETIEGILARYDMDCGGDK